MENVVEWNKIQITFSRTARKWSVEDTISSVLYGTPSIGILLLDTDVFLIIIYFVIITIKTIIGVGAPDVILGGFVSIYLFVCICLLPDDRIEYLTSIYWTKWVAVFSMFNNLVP